MLFLIIFSLAIAGITITELPVVIILLRSPAVILFLCVKTFSYVYAFSKEFLLYSTGACCLALASRQVYQWRYDGAVLYASQGNEGYSIVSTHEKATNTGLSSIPNIQPSVSNNIFHLSTGVISDIIGSGKYLYTSNASDYLLYSTKIYLPGNQIRLVARNALQWTKSPPLHKISRESIFYSGFNGQKRSKMKGYNNLLYETNSILIHSGNRKGFSKIRYFLRQRLEQTYKNNKTAGLVLGMLIGDKSKFSKSEYQLFVDSGLVHLVAVSGGNIVMLVTFLTAILFFIPFYARISLILLAVLGYGIVCGMDSSVLRAVLMGGLSLVALLIGRGSSLRRLLGLVYIGMLVYNPYFLVYDVGYLLSFSAVLGIVFIDTFQSSSKSISTRYSKPFLRVRKNYLKPSLGATLGIFPVIIFFMGKINIGGVIGNMFVLPLVPLIMIGGFIGGFLPSQLQKYYTPCIDFLVNWNYKVAGWIDQYGLIIVAESPRIKILLLGLSTTMMIVVIKTLTQHEPAKTIGDKENKDSDITKTSIYDDIFH